MDPNSFQDTQKRIGPFANLEDFLNESTEMPSFFSHLPIEQSTPRLQKTNVNPPSGKLESISPAVHFPAEKIDRKERRTKNKIEIKKKKNKASTKAAKKDSKGTNRINNYHLPSGQKKGIIQLRR